MVYRANRGIIVGAAPVHRSDGTKVVPLRPKTGPAYSVAQDGLAKEPEALLAAISLGAFLATVLISMAIKLCLS